MITVSDHVFHIRTPELSYLFRVNGYGQLEHLHFGAPVDGADAAALACRPGLGWGCAVPYEDAPGAPSPDWMPLEWSGPGRGDYRESPAELETADGRPLAADFRFTASDVRRGCVPMSCGLPQARGGEETLILTLEDAALGARLTLYWTAFGGALTRRAALENTGTRPLALRRLMSFCVDLPGAFRMTTFDGGWIAEAHRSDTDVGAARVVNESVTGFSSQRHNPGFLLSEPDAGEDWGRVYGFNLVYSGNHYASAQRSPQGLTRVMQGVSPAAFRWELPPGARFETPEAVLSFSDAGYNGLSARMHAFVNGHIVPETWRGRERPVVFNSWEGCMFGFTQPKLLELARRAGKLGCELFVLDDGWFGARSDDRAGLGDYAVNRKKLPDGLDGLAERLKKLGLAFGLWFEPEAVNPDSDLFRSHPDWALTEPGRESLLSRHELLLDLTRPEVRDYIVESVSAVLESADISYVKWDMNRPSPAQGARAHAYVLGLYDVLRRLFGPRPELLLESCASGGGRFDLGMLCFSPQIWCSDDTDPAERLDIQGGLSYLYPLSCMSAHISQAPHAQTLRQTPLSTRGNAAFFGCCGCELDLRHLVSVEERELAAQLAFYKAHRRTFQFGAFRRLAAPEGQTAWLVGGEGEHIAGLFRRLSHAAPGYETLRVPGLEHGRRYRVSGRPQGLRVGDFGGLVRHIAPVALDPNGPVLRAADRLYRMTDAAEEYVASGAALEAGIPLAARFTGTGYDPGARIQGDFGSNLYLIEEEKGNDENG